MSSCTHAYGFPWNRPRNEIAEPYSVCIFIFIRWCILPIVEVEFVLAVSLPQQHMVLSNFKFLSIWIVFSGISEWILVFIFWFTLYGIGSWKLFSFSTWKMSMTCLALLLLGFPGGSVGKESACNARDLGSIPGLGRSPEEGNGYPLQHSGLENSIDGGAWQATVHGVAKSQTWLRLLSLTAINSAVS